jgi:large subunit ribosomal protein L4
MYRAALKTIMSELARQGRLVVVESVGCSMRRRPSCWYSQLDAYGVNSALLVVR